MILLVLGVVLWWAAHLLKRLAPGVRAAMGEGPGKGAVAVALVLSIVLMTIGYQRAEPVFLWALGDWTWHLNNLLMVFAVALLGAGRSRGRARSLLRHPMLTGVVVWAVAHLLVNGDLASLVLFGGLGAWALVHMQLINAQSGPWVRPEPGPISGDLRLLVIALVLYAAILAAHWFLFGVKPFPG